MSGNMTCSLVEYAHIRGFWEFFLLIVMRRREYLGYFDVDSFGYRSLFMNCDLDEGCIRSRKEVNWYRRKEIMFACSKRDKEYVKECMMKSSLGPLPGSSGPRYPLPSMVMPTNLNRTGSNYVGNSMQNSISMTSSDSNSTGNALLAGLSSHGNSNNLNSNLINSLNSLQSLTGSSSSQCHS